MATKKTGSGTSGDDPDWRIDADGARVFGNLVGYNLRRAHVLQRQHFADSFRRADIRPVQLSLLGLIHNNPGVRPSELCRVLDIKRTNIVPLIDGLEKRGLVERKQSPSDGRLRVLFLTPSGTALTKKLLERHDLMEQDLAQRLGAKNRHRLIQLLIEFRNLGLAQGLND